MDKAHSKESLRIGYFTDSDLLEISPGSKQAISTAKVILESRGHEVVEFDIGSLREGVLGLAKLFSIDQGKMAAQNLQVEPGHIKAVQNSVLFAQLPKFLVRLVSKFYKWKQD